MELLAMWVTPEQGLFIDKWREGGAKMLEIIRASHPGRTEKTRLCENQRFS